MKLLLNQILVITFGNILCLNVYTGSTDFLNVVVHALAHVTPLRNFFLNPLNYKNNSNTVVMAFGELLRKVRDRYQLTALVYSHLIYSHLI